MIRFDEENRVLTSQVSRAVIVGLGTGEDITNSMEELRGLAEACDAEVLGEMVQNADEVNVSTYIGKGKVEELREFCEAMEADLAVFNDELTGLQLRNLEEALGVKVVDRTILVLDIFARRAQSAEAKLQVEFAQLQYRLPRLTGFGKALSRLGGGVGTRGPGEKKLETDRRHIRRRMDDIRRELREIDKGRGVRKSTRERSGIPLVALVGYTNAGKSSVMNRLLAMEEREDKSVFEADMLFATLDTKKRAISPRKNLQFVLLDTVGFVSDLPHALVKAFRATLEEASEADLLLHIVDGSREDRDFQIEVTQKVLYEIGAADKPSILVFNKMDLCSQQNGYQVSNSGMPGGPVRISSKTGEGYEELIDAIESAISKDSCTEYLLIPHSRGEVFSRLMEAGQAREVRHLAEGTYVVARLPYTERGRYREFFTEKADAQV